MSSIYSGSSSAGISLKSIGLTLGLGLGVSFLSILAFGIAVMKRHTNIAPRCTARHPNTIWRWRKDMYGDKKAANKMKTKSSLSSSDSLHRRGNVVAVVSNEDANGNDKHTKRPSIAKRNTSLHEAPRIAVNTAAKIVTGVDISGMTRSQQSIRQLEEQEQQQRGFVQNSLGQPVYVGSGAARNNNDTETLDEILAEVFTAHTLPPQALPPVADVGEPVIVTDPKIEKDGGGDNELYSHPQDRGNPFLGWIPWTLNLSYDRMLRGIPGTGTRSGGMSGQLLAVNLDAIILFKFHALCLRVTVIACIFCIGIILPINLTACDEHQLCRAATSPSGQNVTTFLTNYGRTTIANIPYNAQTKSSIGTLNNQILSTKFWTDVNLDHLLRLYAISFVTWFIYYFALKNIKREWTENLVLRRVYYLEADHYGNRRSELDQTAFLPRIENDDDDSDDEMDLKKRRAINKNGRKSRNYKRRQPWIPNPEHRDTVPNIELYSVLVGGLPSLPNEVVNKTDLETAVQASAQSNVDWQLALATTFFDHCVPNQPGFTSSVVAVTILPGAKELAKSWRKWYAAAAALRRLRFIRKVINEKRHYSIDEVQVDDDESEAIPDSNVPQGSLNLKPRVTFLDEETAAYRFQDFEANRQAARYRQTYGERQNSSDIDTQIFRSLNYGPEQQAVYSREMAQGAAACCPNGCCEGRVRREAIDRLLEMEIKTIERLENAQKELQQAQSEAAVSMPEVKSNAAEDGETEIILMPKHKSGTDLPTMEQSLNNTPTVDVQPKNVEFLNDNYVDGHQQCMQTIGESPSSSLHAVTSPRSAQKNSFPSSSILRMNSEGMFLFQSIDEDDQSIAGESYLESSVSVRRQANTSQSEISLRRRANTGNSSVLGCAPSQTSFEITSATGNQWDRVNSIMRGDKAGEKTPEQNPIESGVWEKPSIKSCLSSVKSEFIAGLKAIGRWTKAKSDPIASKLAKHSTYAVVTFSSRQAAVAARHCLADGRGQERWLSLETVPVPPLADAAPCDIITCRGCCRPVTLNINQNEQLVRKFFANASLLFIYVFYTVPITTAQKLVEPASLRKTFPRLYDLLEEGDGFVSADLISGLVGALLYTTFFALCPVMFKSIANSGSRATSVQEAEAYALKYYWFFMFVTAFVLTAFADAAIQIWNSSALEDTVQTMLKNIAANTPLGVSAIWLNWIIVRTTMTLPLQYLLQVNSFIFDFLGWKCCARCVMGGGPGGPIPYRIYIDGGVVFLCVVGLAPQSPLVAAAALLYFLFCTPLWRRNCIFMYRPKFDSGGERWPFLSDVLISSLFMGQFLLFMQMLLRDALGPAIVACIPVIPTYLYRRNLLKRFSRAYKDAGLLQMSLLDGWDTSMTSTFENREAFRQFLVDAHKAAYIPVCIAGGATNVLTAEPAAVVASDNDDILGYSEVINNSSQTQTPRPQDFLSPYFGDQAPVFFSGTSSGAINSIPSPETVATPSRTIMTRRTNPLRARATSPTTWQTSSQYDSASQNLEDKGCTQS